MRAFLVVAGVLAGAACVVRAGAETPRRLLRVEFTQEPAASGAGTRTLLVRRVDAPPAIDGRLDDAAWTRGSRTSRFAPIPPAEKVGESPQAWLCQHGGVLYVGLRCPATRSAKGAAESPPAARAALLFDSLHDEATFQGVMVRPDGRWTEVRSAKQTSILKGTRVAVWAGREAWTLEAAFEQRLFADADNAIWGFNAVVRDAQGRLFSWNPVRKGPTLPGHFGHLAFETTPYGIKAARLPMLHRGTNTLEVAVVNQGPANANLKAALAVGPENGKPVRNQYKFTVPARQAQWLAFDFPVRKPGRYDLSFGLFEFESERLIARFTRRGAEVASVIHLECPAAPDPAGNVVATLDIRLPRAALEAARLQVSLKAEGESRPLDFLRVRTVTTRRARIRCEAATLAPGRYTLRATVFSRIGTETAAAPFSIPPATAR